MEIGRVYSLCCQTGDTCLDVGANVGQSARLISPLVGRAGRCLSFECHPGHFAALASLAAEEGFGNVEPFCRALSREVGHATMFFGDRPDVAEASTLMPELAHPARLGRTIRRLKVETDTIDRFCRERAGRPALIKVDVEGAEEWVFAGARSVLRDSRPHLVFEFGHGFAGGGAPAHFQWLGDLGYRFFIADLTGYRSRPACFPDLADTLVEVTVEELKRAAVCSGNIFAPQAAKAAEVLSRVTVLPFALAEPRVRFTSPSLKGRLVSAGHRAEVRMLKGVALGYRAMRSVVVGTARSVLRLTGK